MYYRDMDSIIELIEQLQKHQKKAGEIISIQFTKFRDLTEVHGDMKLLAFMREYSAIIPKENTEFYKLITEDDPENKNHKYYIDYKGIRFFALGTPEEAAQYGLHV